MAELADGLGSGPSGGNPVEVQVLSSALLQHKDLRQIDVSPIFIGVHHLYNNLTTRGTRVASCGIQATRDTCPIDSPG